MKHYGKLLWKILPWKCILKKRKTRWTFDKSKQKVEDYYSRLYNKERKFFNNLKPKFVSDDKLFWKAVNDASFSNKGNYGANIKPLQKEEIIQIDDKVAETLDNLS